MLFDIEPNDDEMYLDHLINATWFGAKDLCNNVNKFPQDRIPEALKNIEDTINLLQIAKLGFENKKQ